MNRNAGYGRGWRLAGLGLLLMTGCATVAPQLASVDDSVRGYNRALRWRETEQAASHVAEEMREKFRRQAEGMREVRITDCRVISVAVDRQWLTAVATVEMDYYLTDSARLRSITQQQFWRYREMEGWRLLTPLPEFK
jgi:hypothetical protein